MIYTILSISLKLLNYIFLHSKYNIRKIHTSHMDLLLQSMLHLVFRDEKDPNVEIQHWRYWHAQQANPQQRAFDIGKAVHLLFILFEKKFFKD